MKINRIQYQGLEMQFARLQLERQQQINLYNEKFDNAKLNLAAREMSVKMSDLALQKGTLQYEMGVISLLELRMLQNQSLNNQIDLLTAKNTFVMFELDMIAQNEINFRKKRPRQLSHHTPQPTFHFNNTPTLSSGQIVHLFFGDFSESKILRFRMSKIPTANSGCRNHGETFC